MSDVVEMSEQPYKHTGILNMYSVEQHGPLASRHASREGGDCACEKALSAQKTSSPSKLLAGYMGLGRRGADSVRRTLCVDCVPQNACSSMCITSASCFCLLAQYI